MSKPLTDQLRAYFDDVDRQQGTVDIDALKRSVSEREVMIEMSPDTAVRPHATISGRSRLILVAAAAVVLVVGATALVAIRVDDATPADKPFPVVTVPPTTPPRALFGTYDEQLLPGTYFVDEVVGHPTVGVETTPTPRIFLTIGEGWSNFGDNWGLVKDGTIVFSRPAQVFSDACHWSDGFYPGSVETLDGLVAALSGQRGWADVTVPSDIAIDGYAGKAFQRTVPASMSDCTILGGWGPRRGTPGSYPAFRSWASPDLPPYERGQVETVWVLDLDGTLVVISARPFPEASAEGTAEVVAVLDSIRIDPA